MIWHYSCIFQDNKRYNQYYYVTIPMKKSIKDWLIVAFPGHLLYWHLKRT